MMSPSDGRSQRVTVEIPLDFFPAISVAVTMTVSTTSLPTKRLSFPTSLAVREFIVSDPVHVDVIEVVEAGEGNTTATGSQMKVLLS